MRTRRFGPLAAGIMVGVLLTACGRTPPRAVTGTPSAAPAGEMGPVPSATAGSRCLTSAELAHVVHFHSDNGAALAGVLLGAGRVGVVFAHSNNTDLCDWVPYARVLARQGYVALSIDLNGYGASQASAGVPVDPRYDEDLSAAVRLLRGRGVLVDFLVGEVIGGTAAVKAATEITPPVAGVVDVSSPAQALHIDGVAAARRLRVPLLCIASDSDEFLDGTREIAGAAVGAPDHQLLVLSGATGSETTLFDPGFQPQAAAVVAQVAAFLTRHSS